MQKNEWRKGNFPRRVKRARLNVGLTQAKLAHHLGTQQSTISRIEKGQKPGIPLLSGLLAFIEEAERSRPGIQDDVVLAIAQSDEMKALIARIAAEL